MDLISVLRNSSLHATEGISRIFNLRGSSPALLLALESRPFIAVEKDEEKAQRLTRDIRFYRKLLSGGDVHLFPDANGASSSGCRARIIYFQNDSDSIVTSSKNLRSTLWDRNSLEGNTVLVRKGLIIERSKLEESLIRLGYRKMPMVLERGEYSQRGWISDIFPSTDEHPLRIEFFGDEIEQIRQFDIDSQRSTEEKKEILLFPASESDDVRNLADVFSGRRLYSLMPAEEEKAFPADTVTLSIYPFEIDVPSEGDSGEKIEVVPQKDAGTLSLKGLGVLPEERKGIEDLAESVQKLTEKNRVILIASSVGQAERLKDIFRDHDMIIPLVGLHELADFQGNISLTVAQVSSGLFLDGLVILTERELFGQRSFFRPMIKSKVSNLLFSLDDIAPGDFVVHKEHGIGRFSGIVRQQVHGTELELMLIEYLEGRLYMPVQNITNISKYHSRAGVIPKMDRMGGKTWKRKKERVRKKVHEMASRLLFLYADRRVSRGFAYSADTELHREFDSFFGYEETPDQLKAVEEIKRDMESDMPMDRLLCGDVGYGKTEVAMRAAFKAVYDNRQVAVLVPTTILAEQHYRTFRERFAGFPLTVDYLSRFKSRKEIGSTLKGISNGSIDIIIGTHKLLSKKVVFSRLGLLIIDEEHRFGVGQKERIKEISRRVDVLTLTATPIPRTLHMALSGIRNISTIDTPPEERLSVKSVVTTFHDNHLKEPIEKELLRNGQVFFVHNRIQDIHRIASRLGRMAPRAEIGVAHGQMPEKELELIMHRFFEGAIDLLVSTAIVGSGLDIPRANTIIINQADRMGLADLYQLRGRVGRSNLKAYAYFLVPPESQMTEEAKKRLQAVQEMSYLGAGFRLALKDLEIRGAGDIFGPEQSGHIQDVGFDLYIEMLEKAVAELKGIDVREEVEPVVDLKVSAFLPDDYIEDMTLRLSFYRRIASLKTEEEIGELMSELKDRFGSPPEEVNNLLDIVNLKISARKLSVTKLQDKKGKIKITFFDNTMVETQHMFALHKRRGKMITFHPDGFVLDVSGFLWKEVYREVHAVLDELGENIKTQG